jgi:hypothetical protein
MDESIKKRQIRWSEADPNIFLASYDTLYYYKLSAPDFQRILLSQQSACAICHINFAEIDLKICIDHCHRTGRVRGLLCHACNKGLGHFRENPVSMSNAIQYLQQTEEIHIPIR